MSRGTRASASISSGRSSRAASRSTQVSATGKSARCVFVPSQCLSLDVFIDVFAQEKCQLTKQNPNAQGDALVETDP